MMHQIIIDCDPGIDDALALLLAAGSAQLDILAVTTVAGNRPVQTTSRNARKILDLAGKHQVPVYAGAAIPFGGTEARCNLVHGEDGLGGVELPVEGVIHEGHAATKLVELLSNHPAGTIELIAVGPLTNLALAEMLSPGILKRARRLLIMGGAVQVPGNITTAAEFNFYADPLAAHMVLAAQAEVFLFPLDVTSKAIMSAEWINSFSLMGSRCGTAASAMLAAYAACDPLLHDACPVAFLLEPDLFEGLPCSLAVDWRPGPTEGYVVTQRLDAQHDSSKPNATVMIEVKPADLLDLVHQAIATLP